jgi:hypothetical protein
MSGIQSSRICSTRDARRREWLTILRRCSLISGLILCVMLNVGDTVHLSASDLVGHLNCPYLTSLDLAVANGMLPKPLIWGPVLEILAERGALHEQGYVDHLKTNGLSVTAIDGVGVDSSVVAQTLEAMKAGAQIGRGAGLWKRMYHFQPRRVLAAVSKRRVHILNDRGQAWRCSTTPQHLLLDPIGARTRNQFSLLGQQSPEAMPLYYWPISTIPEAPQRNHSLRKHRCSMAVFRLCTTTFISGRILVQRGVLHKKSPSSPSISSAPP